MVPVGQTYRSTGPIRVVSVVVLLIAGLIVAVLGAMWVWALELRPLPIFIPIAQGLLMGWGLAWVVAKARMPHPGVALVIGLACGLLSEALVHLSHEYRLIAPLAAEYRRDVKAAAGLSRDQKRREVELAVKEPRTAADRVLEKRTGHRGFLGSLLWRNEVGIPIRSLNLSGQGLWFLWALEALIVAGLPARMATSRADEPFCEDCGDWCHRQTAPLVLPGEAAEALEEAVRTDDPARVVELRDYPPETAGLSRAGATLYSCSGCDRTFADVWQKVDGSRKKSMAVTYIFVERIAISPRMVRLFRHQPVASVDED